MYYCEFCHISNEKNICKICNTNNLRKIESDDLCFFTDLNSINAKIFESALDSEGIKYVVMPIRKSVISAKFALDFDHRIFISYKDFNKAKEILNFIPKV